ncbi:MAG: flagellar biosynthetic protein FliO [Spirochaetia bacterium]
MKFTKQVCLVLMMAAVGTAALTGQENTQNQDIQQSQESAQPEEEVSEEGEIGSAGRDAQQAEEEELQIDDAETPETEMEGGLTQFSLWDFLRMFLILGAVIAAIYGIFFILKRLGNPSFQGNSLISVLSTQNLQGNRSLHLVEVGNEVFLIGSSEGGVELVGKIEDQETLDQVKLYRSEMSAGGQSFQRSLKDIFQRGKGTNGEKVSASGKEENTGASAFFMKKQRERLKNL